MNAVSTMQTALNSVTTLWVASNARACQDLSLPVMDLHAMVRP